MSGMGWTGWEEVPTDLASWTHIGTTDQDAPHLLRKGERLRVRLENGDYIECVVGNVEKDESRMSTYTVTIDPITDA
jgi:hypothetical protein